MFNGEVVRVEVDRSGPGEGWGKETGGEGDVGRGGRGVGRETGGGVEVEGEER